MKSTDFRKAVSIAAWSKLENKVPHGAQVLGTDLVIIRYGDEASVLYGRCLHRGALLADGFVEGENLICGLHNWDYRYDTGVSEYNPAERLYKFTSLIEEGKVWIDEEEVREFEAKAVPPPFDEDEYLGKYADTHPEATEPYTKYIKHLAQHGLSKWGHHGQTQAMGVDRNTLPKWEHIQILPAQLHSKPLFDEDPVEMKTIIGPRAEKPLELELPIFVSDMSYGALSREAKIAMATGAEMAGTGICSGEGGMLEAENQANSRYFYELASGGFGFAMEKVKRSKAFHFKAGQGAKTGTGGHLPGHKVTEEIAEVRGLKVGEAAISPATFKDLRSPEDFRRMADEIRLHTGGIPIGFKMAASHIEKDIDFALKVGVDYIILDGRGGGTGAAPLILRDNINVPTIPALARARRHLDLRGAEAVSLIVTGGLRVAEDFVKALALGADAVAIANSAMQAIGCLGMRACHTDNCPVGIASMKQHFRQRLEIQKSAKQLHNFFEASKELMAVLARACGHEKIGDFTW